MQKTFNDILHFFYILLITIFFKGFFLYIFKIQTSILTNLQDKFNNIDETVPFVDVQRFIDSFIFFQTTKKRHKFKNDLGYTKKKRYPFGLVNVELVPNDILKKNS